MRYQAPRGTADVLPQDAHRWIELEGIWRELTARYGYREIRTPVFEDTELFVRSSGETSDIVTKQMYTFLDKGDRSLTLKPEGTAPAIRAAIEHRLCPPGAVARLSYVTPIYRYERPQKGRLREAHQFGLELLGSDSFLADAEIIEVTHRFYESIGLQGTNVLLNSIGREACRAAFREEILSAAKTYLAGQSEEARQKAEKNPLRLLDSKDPEAREALEGLRPITDFLEDASKARLDGVQEALSAAGVPFQLAPTIVRGLDYYTEIVFEVQSGDLGAQNSLCGGGRYDGLVQELGGPPTPAVGVGIGIERALLVLEAQGQASEAPAADFFLIATEERFLGETLALARRLRAQGRTCLYELEVRSLRALLRQADKSGARYALIFGEEERAAGEVTRRDLRSGEQERWPLDALFESIGKAKA